MDKKLIRRFGKALFPLLVAAIFASISGAFAGEVVAKVGSIPLKGGKHQVTINGRPIYIFAFDKAAGQIKGQGAQGVWYVISPSGSEIKVLTLAAKPAPATASATPVVKSRY